MGTKRFDAFLIEFDKLEALQGFGKLLVVIYARDRMLFCSCLKREVGVKIPMDSCRRLQIMNVLKAKDGVWTWLVLMMCATLLQVVVDMSYFESPNDAFGAHSVSLQ